MRKAIPIIILGAAGLYFYSQFKQFASGMAAKIGGVKFNLKESQKSLFTKIVLDVNINVSNPSRVQGIIQGAKIDALLGNRIVAVVNQTGNIPVAPSTTTTIPVQVAINTLAIVPAISNLIAIIGKGIAQTLIIKGELKTNFGVVSINEKISFTV